MFLVLAFLTVCKIHFSPSYFPGCVLHHCWPATLLAALRVLLVMSGGGGTVPFAAGGIRGTQLQEEIFLPVWLLYPRAGGGRLCSHRLQRLRFKNCVSVSVRKLKVFTTLHSCFSSDRSSLLCVCVCACVFLSFSEIVLTDFPLILNFFILRSYHILCFYPIFYSL